MNKEQLQQRIEEIKKVVDQSAANHNALIGRLNEATHLLSMFEVCDLDDVEVRESQEVDAAVAD